MLLSSLGVWRLFRYFRPHRRAAGGGRSAEWVTVDERDWQVTWRVYEQVRWSVVTPVTSCRRAGAHLHRRGWRMRVSTAARPTCGSSCCSCCTTMTTVRATSSGPTVTEASSSWSTPRPSRTCGDCTRTNPTWTMRPWDALCGQQPSTPRHALLSASFSILDRNWWIFSRTLRNCLCYNSVYLI